MDGPGNWEYQRQKVRENLNKKFFTRTILTMKFWVMIWIPKKLGWKTQLVTSSTYKDTLVKLQNLSFLEGTQRVDFRKQIRNNISFKDYRRNLIQTISSLSETEAQRIVSALKDHDNYHQAPGGPWLHDPWWPYQDFEWEGSRFTTFI